MQQQYTGTVIRYIPRWGWISRDDDPSQSLFVFESRICPRKSGERVLLRGDRVAFEISRDKDNRPMAVNVRVIAGVHAQKLERNSR